MTLNEKDIARRSFLKGSAAAAAAVASLGVFGCAPKETSDEGDLASTGTKAHQVDSDVAVLEGDGEWKPVDCWHNCGGRCVNKAFVRDGVVIRSKTDDGLEDTLETPQIRACARGRAQIQQVYNVERLKYPVKRKSWQPGGGENAHGELRGQDEWERISWEEALDLVSGEIKRIYDTYGPRSAIGNWEFSTPLLSAMGGAVVYDGTMSYGHWMLLENEIGTEFAWALGADMKNTNDRRDMVNADTIVFYGMNPVWASAGTPNYYFKLAQEAGVQFVTVGPSYNASAHNLNARWIRVRPGSDIAFLLAVAYEMIRLDGEKGDIIDWDFLHKYSVGFDSESMPADAVLDENFQDYVLGKYDGIPKTPEWATEICGTPVEDITWYAETVGKKNNVMLYHSYPATRYNGAEDLPQLFLTIGCMGGHMGKKGNACGSAYHAKAGNDGPNLVQWGSPSAFSTVANPLEKPYICAPEFWESVYNGKYTYRGFAAMIQSTNYFEPEEEIEFDPKMLFMGKSNIVQQSMDVNMAIKAIKKLDFVVKLDYQPTVGSEYSDIVLPVTTPWEGNLDPAKGELWLSDSFNGRKGNTQREMFFCPVPVIDAVYEAKTDEWIYRQLAQRLGVDENALYPISSVQSFYDTLAGATVICEDGVNFEPLITITQADIDAWGVTGEPQEGRIALQDLLKDGVYRVPVPQDSDVYGCIGYKDFIDDPEANPRPSASGKFEIYSQAKADKLNLINPKSEFKIKPYPTYYRARNNYEDTFSNWETKEKGQYPFQMYQPHYLHRSHTEFDNIPWLQEAFASPVFINTDDAAAKGIKTGDTVLISNDRGQILRRASVLSSIMPGCIACPHGPRTRFDPETGIDLGGNENVLLGSGQQSRYFKQAEGYNSCLVDFEKYDGDPIPEKYEIEPIVMVEE